MKKSTKSVLMWVSIWFFCILGFIGFIWYQAYVIATVPAYASPAQKAAAEKEAEQFYGREFHLAKVSPIFEHEYNYEYLFVDNNFKPYKIRVAEEMFSSSYYFQLQLGSAVRFDKASGTKKYPDLVAEYLKPTLLGVNP